jgi:hypothetical protein
MDRIKRGVVLFTLALVLLVVPAARPSWAQQFFTMQVQQSRSGLVEVVEVERGRVRKHDSVLNLIDTHEYGLRLFSPSLGAGGTNRYYLNIGDNDLQKIDGNDQISTFGALTIPPGMSLVAQAACGSRVCVLFSSGCHIGDRDLIESFGSDGSVIRGELGEKVVPICARDMMEMNGILYELEQRPDDLGVFIDRFDLNGQHMSGSFGLPFKFQSVAQAIAPNREDPRFFFALDTDYQTFATLRKLNATNGIEDAVENFPVDEWVPFDIDHFSTGSQVVLVAAGSHGFSVGKYLIAGFDDQTLDLINLSIFDY